MIAAISLAARHARADKSWVEPEIIKVPHLSWTSTIDVPGDVGSATRTRVDIDNIELRKYGASRDWIATAGSWKVSGESKFWHRAPPDGCSSRQAMVFSGTGQLGNRAGSTSSGKLKLDRQHGTYTLSFIVPYMVHMTEWVPCPAGGEGMPPDATTLVMPTITAAATFEPPNVVKLDFETDEVMGPSHTVTTGKGSGDAKTCGPDVSDALRATVQKIHDHWNGLGTARRLRICQIFVNPSVAWFAWDMAGMHHEGEWTQCGGECATPQVDGGGCYSTVNIDNRCFYTGSVNYLMEGVYARLCQDEPLPVLDGGNYQDLIYFWKVEYEAMKGKGPAANYFTASQWAEAGYRGWPDGAATPMPEPRYTSCARSCSKGFAESYPYRSSVPGTFQVRLLYFGPD